MAIPILIVDDEPNFLQLMIGVLGKKGFDVNTALTGREALEMLEKEMFDFALLDIRMAPMGGLALLQEIKRRQPRIRAIMMTAYPTEETRLEATEKGASAYLAKPLDLSTLLQTFASALTH